MNIPSNVRAAWNCLRGRPTIYRCRFELGNRRALFSDDGDAMISGVEDTAMPMAIDCLFDLEEAAVQAAFRYHLRDAPVYGQS